MIKQECIGIPDMILLLMKESRNSSVPPILVIEESNFEGRKSEPFVIQED